MSDAAEIQPGCHHSRTDLLDLLAARRNGPAPRIDTVTNRVKATQQLLGMVAEELADLNVLAYDRYQAQREVNVAGGSIDYALDTHGDTRARDAYRALNFATVDALEMLATTAHDLLKILRTGERGRGRRTIKIEELALAIESQASREARGEYTPVAREPQPEAEQAEKVLDQVTRERDRAIEQVERLTKRLAKAEGEARHAAERRRR